MKDCEKRIELLNQKKALEEVWKQKDAALADDDSISDEEYERKSNELYEQYRKESDLIYWKAFALQFPKRRGWFAETFAPSFGLCESKRISAKQTDVFKKYCVCDEDTWTTGKYHCRYDDKIVILSLPKYANGFGYVTIKQL